MVLVENFLVQKQFRHPGLERMSAREVDAYLTLEEVVRTEMRDGQQDSRDHI